MRIGIQTWGTHGDIRPFLALAGGLAAAGHEVKAAVTSITGTTYDDTAARLGFSLDHIGMPVLKTREQARRAVDRIGGERDEIKQARAIVEEMLLPVEAEIYAAAEALSRECDIVIGQFFTYPIQVAAEKVGTPLVSLSLVHSILPTCHRPPRGLPNLGRFGNRLLWSLADRMLSRSLIEFPNRLRAAKGLPPLRSMMREVWGGGQLDMIAVSPLVSPLQDDWPDTVRVCGFLDLPPDGQAIDADLAAFLDAGPAPVFMGIGSMMPRALGAQKALIEVFAAAASKADARAVIQAPGWAECGVAPDDRVHFVAGAPHARVFPRCAAVVHHGGAGTLHTTIRAGVPSVVVAHTGEQRFWGAEVARLGIGGPTLTTQDLAADALAKSIRAATGDPAVRTRAAALGRRMADEDGVATAVAMIEAEFG